MRTKLVLSGALLCSVVVPAVAPAAEYNPVRTANVASAWCMNGWVTLPTYQSRYPALEQHSIDTPVTFVGYANGKACPDLRLAAWTGAINEGTSLSSVGGLDFAVDDDGVALPKGGWDAGAHEYKLETSTRPAAPMRLRIK